MFINYSKFIGFILFTLLCLTLGVPLSFALDTRGVTGYTEIYGSINAEVKAYGHGVKNNTENQQEFIHYHNLGLKSYIWDPRLVQFDVSGNFYQDYITGDILTRDFILYGGSAAATFFPYSILPMTVFGSRQQSIDPRQEITEGGAETAFIKRGWPSLYLSGTYVNFKSDEKSFRQDTVYLSGSARFVYQVFIKPLRLRVKGKDQNGNGENGKNGKNGKNGNGKNAEEPGGGRLMIDISYDYQSIDDKLKEIFTSYQRGIIFLGYFFNNNRINIINYTYWTRNGDTDSYTDSLSYFHQWSPTLGYNLGLSYSYTTQFFTDRVTTNDGQSVVATGVLSKIFSPQWNGTLSAAGHFDSNNQKQSSWGASGYGSIYNRTLLNFDWGASIGGGVESDVDHNITKKYNAGLLGLYRLSPNNILGANGSFSYISGTGGTFGWDGRARLTFDSIWSPNFTLRSVAEYGYQDFSQLRFDSQEVVNGKRQDGSFDVYGLYRLTPKTSLYAGVNFTYVNTDSTTNKFVRAYATVSSSPWANFNCSLTAGYDYAIDGKWWTARVNPQIYYLWRKVYFVLWAEFDYVSQINRPDSNRWNYYVNFKISRPFSIKFF